MNIKTPSVGTPVQFYVGGDTNNKPQAAIVVESFGEGRVKLVLIPPHGGELLQTGQTIHHVDDPQIADNPELVRGTWRGHVRGAWDWRPEDKGQDSQVDRKAEGAVKVREMLDQGKDVDQIARSVRSYGMNRSDVEIIVGQHRETVNA